MNKFKPEDRILIVEDDETYMQLVAFSIEDMGFPKKQILRAYNLAQGEELFRENQDCVIAVCMDGSVDTRPNLDSLPLIDFIIKTGFIGPIIAMSSYGPFRDEMVKSGCTHHSSDKEKTGEVLAKIFEQQQ